MNIFITGGSRGIGKAIVERFVQDGHSVYAPTREELDLSKKIDLVRSEFDVVINNAGINPLKHIVDVSDEEVMRVNYLSPLEIVQQCLPHMEKQRFGRIVNIGSVWIDLAKPKRSAYAASKCALNSLTKSLTAEYASKGILTNTVSPGFIGTDLTFQNNTQEELTTIVSNVPIGRLGTPADVAEMVYFLGSSKNNFITGQNIFVDGGYLCVA
jgi:NAD(P)-dependent dehydrogenase (short-subunit alcohol dehydrogenase family)